MQSWLGSATKAAKNPAGVEAAKQFLAKTTDRESQHAALGPPEGLGPSTGALGAAKGLREGLSGAAGAARTASREHPRSEFAGFFS